MVLRRYLHQDIANVQYREHGCELEIVEIKVLFKTAQPSCTVKELKNAPMEMKGVLRSIVSINICGKCPWHIKEKFREANAHN